MDEARHLYDQIAKRTAGSIYIGVVGPVRTGKSTFIKRFMEQLVLPNLENTYQRDRARDELPQSGSGRTIMTTEPKFVPEQAVEISPDGTSRLKVRLIDSVGYLVPGAMGAEEEGTPRMVMTPWSQTELPLEQAAEIGTKKVMEEHSSIGIVMTTDGSVTDIPASDYASAQDRAISDMLATGKPFVILVNSEHPESGEGRRWRGISLRNTASARGRSMRLQWTKSRSRDFDGPHVRVSGDGAPVLSARLGAGAAGRWRGQAGPVCCDAAGSREARKNRAGRGRDEGPGKSRAGAGTFHHGRRRWYGNDYR